MGALISFKEAIIAASTQKPHLLLGNGFSRSFKEDVFAYEALFDRADFKNLSPTAKKAFKALNTTDFEVVMRALRQAVALVNVYIQQPAAVVKAMAADADGLRDVLVQAIAGSHPERPNSVTQAQYKSCKQFLDNFGSIYTLNYDLLLYWTLMQDEIDPQIKCDDGFRQPEDGPEKYVTWEVQNTNSQNIHYLHGALHIFDAGSKIQKYTWSNTQIALIDQIRTALALNKFPIFVSEGTAEAKLDRIQHSGYLNRAYRSFSAIGGALFIFGHSLAKQDDHILRLIERGKTQALYIGLYGDADSEANKTIIKRAQLIKSRRKKENPGRPVEVTFYDASSAKVWG